MRRNAMFFANIHMCLTMYLLITAFNAVAAEQETAQPRVIEIKIGDVFSRESQAHYEEYKRGNNRDTMRFRILHGPSRIGEDAYTLDTYHATEHRGVLTVTFSKDKYSKVLYICRASRGGVRMNADPNNPEQGRCCVVWNFFNHEHSLSSVLSRYASRVFKKYINLVTAPFVNVVPEPVAEEWDWD